MTTNNESPRVNPETESLFKFVSKKFNAIHQENNSSSSHSLFRCIYKVPDELRKLNKWAYDPRVVSIGPIHNKKKKKKDDDDDNDDDDDREEQHLKATEHIKVAYTKELLYRVAGKLASTEEKVGSIRDALLLECSTAMTDSEDSALNCYAENLKPIIKQKIHQHRLTQMFLIDGCFILGLLYRSYLIRKTEDRNTQDDPLHGKTVIMSGIRHDLLLLENQLPFFILTELFHKTIEKIPDHPGSSCPSLTELVLSFFGNVMNFNNVHIQSITTNLKEHECFHILHLVHSCYQPSSPRPDQRLYSSSQFSHGASDLNCAGVKFEAGTGKDQFDVNFEEASGLLWWYGTAKFKIPPLSIYDSTEPFLRNLIAFEQCCPSSNCHITSYAFLMDSLINSAADVELLEKAQIINNYLGASVDASVLFKNICEHAVLGQFVFAKPRNDAEYHCRRPWPAILALVKRDNLALLKRNYFSNPWSGIAVFAAIILFALALVQTVYTILTYYQGFEKRSP